MRNFLGFDHTIHRDLAADAATAGEVVVKFNDHAQLPLVKSLRIGVEIEVAEWAAVPAEPKTSLVSRMGLKGVLLSVALSE